MADGKEEEWPTYVEFEKMQKEAETYRNNINWATLATKPQEMAAAQAKMAEDSQKTVAYSQKISEATMKWNKQWIRDEDEKGNPDPDMAFFKELMDSSKGTYEYSGKLQGAMTKMHTESKTMEDYEKFAKEILKIEKEQFEPQLARWQKWNPKKVDLKDMREFTVNNMKKILEMKELSYEMQILQGKLRFEIMTMSAEDRAKLMARMGEVQTEMTAGLDKKYAFEPKKEDLEAALYAWNTFAESIEKHPKTLSLDISVEAYEKSVKMSALLASYEEHKRVLTLAHELWEKTLEEKKAQLHPYSLFISQENLMMNTKHTDPYSQRARECETIYKDLCAFMERMSKGTELTHAEKKYAKFLLVWRWQGPTMDGGKDYYHLLHSKATDVMNILRKPLDIEYAKLEKNDSPLIKMKLNDKAKCDKKIKSQRDLLNHAWNDWFIEEDIALTDKEISSIKQDYKQWNFDYFGTKSSEKAKQEGNFDYDKELESFFKSMEKVTTQTYIRYLPSEIVVLDIINQVAYKVDQIFQPKMKELFKLNREKLGYKMDDNDVKTEAVGVFSGPIKTKARQQIKCDTDYKHDPAPRSGSVLDDVRCAIVVADDVELVSLFQLICNDEKNGYKGRIYRAKNAFDDIKKNSFGYRAVLMNVIETYVTKDKNGKEIKFPLIVEIQLILKSYFEIRKTMHLGYSIVRAEDPHSLSRDACKVGVLDI